MGHAYRVLLKPAECAELRLAQAPVLGVHARTKEFALLDKPKLALEEELKLVMPPANGFQMQLVR